MVIEVELLLSAVMLVSGITTLVLRNRPNRFAGVRFGYTLESEEAWRRANTAAGIYLTVLGVLFLVLSLLSLPLAAFFTLYIASLTILIYLSYKVAKETYELEDMKTPVGSFKPLSPDSNLRKVMAVEFASLMAYLLSLAILWNRLPGKIAVHFSFSGPDFYMSRTAGALLFFTIMLAVITSTLLMKREPLLLRRKALRVLAATQILLSVSAISVLLFNVHLLSCRAVMAITLAGVCGVLVAILV